MDHPERIGTWLRHSLHGSIVHSLRKDGSLASPIIVEMTALQRVRNLDQTEQTRLSAGWRRG